MGRKRKKKQLGHCDTNNGEMLSERWYEYDSPLAAYLTEDYVALYAMEWELNTYEDDESLQ